jgi:hypothetical protein
MRGFSPRSLAYMRRLAAAYPEEILQQAVAQLPGVAGRSPTAAPPESSSPPSRPTRTKPSLLPNNSPRSRSDR